jgi:hypothetical protein
MNNTAHDHSDDRPNADSNGRPSDAPGHEAAIALRHSLPIGIVKRIANDSYCAWQRMRLTCTTYHNRLGDYYAHNSITLSSRLNEVEDKTMTHTNLIDIILKTLTSQEGDPQRQAFVWINDRIMIVTHVRMRPELDIWLRVADRRGAFVCSIRDVWKEGNNNINVKAYGRSVDLCMVTYLYSESEAFDYLRDNLPELYSAITPFSPIGTSVSPE